MRFSRTDSAAYLTAQLAKAFSRALHKKASALGFSPGQFPILLELWNEDGITQRQLLDRLDIEQATLANTLARMQRDSLITRKQHPKDKRAQIIELTAQGRSLEEQAIAAAKEADEVAFSGFRRFERELLIEYVQRALKNTSAM
ncbi:MarR family transcriptional regulator [Agrobacterium sp. AGB01]|uniref:MarR family winged helix-turn-helix transcriptional regulator n=1 Tax=Agrobacterium sp. AGB01 TaxID=2769302 RepID=UPI001782B883|nr:MarR family transcriptional regulator [Agrobacterium sp. AGB01]MBD9385999.1 MarR family transcriptional regulator [Agrobacterium sp. AGB01]